MKTRESTESRRRSRHLTPGAVGICVVMLLASTMTLVAAPAAASQAQTAPDQSSGLSTAGGNTSGPLILPGTYVTFTCTHGTISLNGAQYCSHTTTAARDLCDSSSCQFSIAYTVDSGYTFYGWVVSGQASVSGTTLTVYTPNPADTYSASVTLDTSSSPPPPPPTVPVTVVTFENGTAEWLPAEVQACLSGTCSTTGNGGILTLDQNKMYTITAVDLQRSAAFWQWATNAGSLSSNSSSPTQFTPTTSGTLSLITLFRPDSSRGNQSLANVWIGYADSSCAGACTSVSGMFTLPASTGSSGVNMWVGIGGMGGGKGNNYTSLWQAGVQMNASLAGGYTVWAWWVACVGGATYCNATNSPVHYDKSWVINPQDEIFVWIETGGGSSWFEIQDRSELGTPTWSGTDSSFSANTQYVEWIDEPNGTVGLFPPIYVYDLKILGQATTMYAGYLAIENTAVPWFVTPLSVGDLEPGTTSTQFVIEA